MQIKNQEVWDEYKEKNTDFYGGGVINFAQRWAGLMEAAIENDHQLSDVAKQTSHDADTDGITGAMYGAAVKTLSDVWEHGEQLRKWHNAGMGKPDAEGVINPALLTITIDDVT